MVVITKLFFVPLVMMAVILGTNQIYWGSSRSILAGDSYHQYVALHSLYSNILHSAGRNGFFSIRLRVV